MRALVLAMLLVLAAPGLAAADELPPGSVARVGEHVIPKSDFDHWYEIAARSGGYDGPVDAVRASFRRRGPAAPIAAPPPG